MSKNFFEARQDEANAALCFAYPLGTETIDEDGILQLEVKLSSLCQAVIANDIRAVEFLIKVGKHDVNEKMENSRSAIFIAAEFGYNDIITLLIHCGASPNETDIWGMTPLHAACFFRHKKTVQLLLDKKADVHAYSSVMGTPIITAIAKWTHPRRVADPCDVVSILIKHGANVNDKMKSNGMSPLMCAVGDENVKLVNLLVQAKANVNIKFSAVAINESLLEEGLRETVFNFAVLQGNNEIIKALLKASNLNVKQTGVNLFTPLHCACRKGNLDLVKSLVKRKANINALTKAKCTPLHYALHQGYFHIAEYLLEQNDIEVNQQCLAGDLPLHTALLFTANLPPSFKHGMVDRVLKTLILKTDNIDMEGPDRITPLIQAIVVQNIPIIKYLIEEGARVNLTEEQRVSNSKSGTIFLHSPLQKACQARNNVEIVRLLLSYKADVNCSYYTKDDKLQPLAIAIQTGDYEMVRELQKQGAEISNESIKQNNSLAEATSSETELAERKKINDLCRLNLQLLKNVRQNKCKDVEENLKAGACVNVSHAEYGSALIYAAWKDYEDIVDLLLASKANVNFKSRTGFTSLHMASKFHTHSRIILKLLLHGAYYNMPDNKYKKTPLHYTVKDTATFELLHIIHASFQSAYKEDDKDLQGFMCQMADKYGWKTAERLLSEVKSYTGSTISSLVGTEFIIANILYAKFQYF